MSCAKLGPVISRCGAFGTCVNGTICTCQSDSFTQNSEWSFFLDDLDQTETLPCNTNETLLAWLYAIAGVLALLCLLIHILILKSRKKLIKRLSLFVGLIAAVILSFWRVADPSILYGQNKFFSVLWTLAFFMCIHQSLIYNNKFLEFQVQKFHWIGEKDRQQQFANIKKLDKAIEVVTFVVVAPAMFAVAFVSRQVGLILIRVSFVFCGLGYAFHAILDYILIGYFVSNLLQLIDVNDRLQSGEGRNDFFHPKNLKKTSSKLKRTQRSVLRFDIITSLSFLLPVVSDFFLTIWIYFYPLLIIMFCSFVFSFGFPAAVKRLKNSMSGYADSSLDKSKSNTKEATGTQINTDVVTESI